MDEQQHSESKKIFLVIHGHFYQPPRENPWMQAIPFQESAKPFHDWNERITAQCYQPNTRSRVLDEQGRILHLVNNFAHINFNIGPTLFSWLEKYQPDTYKRILEADRKSHESNQGHGNAIAQIYNHIILPLANDRDKTTQIIWGKREFQHRFGREPESIWLAETAINLETVKCLIDQGIKYVILSPTQAQRVRKFGDYTWTEVSNNSIAGTQPYRLFLRDEEQETRSVEEKTKKEEIPDLEPCPKYLDVFFYDGPLSVDISFKHLLRDADTFAGRFSELAAKSSASNVLIHVATDGEVYGHHEPYGEMCLAAAITSKFPSLHVEITNYARYLEMYPPTMEVALKPGRDNDEGTAWSCAHGVGRWYRNCGCSISNNPGWNQEWRTPLRKGFDVLRDGLAELFEQIGGKLLQTPWDARNDYIQCILDPSERTVNMFLDKHAKRPLNEDEQSLVLRLLEAQKYSMYMYTSCAWFFDDISGLEVIQNMRYAARAVQLVEGLRIASCELRSSDLEIQNPKSEIQNFETLMLDEFEKARSNISEFGTGKDIYLKNVKPDVYTPERAANQFLLENFTDRQWSDRQWSDRQRSDRQWSDEKKHHENPSQNKLWSAQRQIHIYTLHCPEYFTWEHTPEQNSSDQCPIVYSGVIRVRETTTRQEWKMLFTSLIEQNTYPVSYLKRVQDKAQLSQLTKNLKGFENLSGLSLPSKLVSFLENNGFKQYDLADVYADDREQLFCMMIQEHVDRTENHIRKIYEESLELLDYLTKMNVQVPAKLKASVEFSLSHQLMIEMEDLHVEDTELHSPALLSSELEKILQLSKIHHLELDTTLLQDRLSEALTKYLCALSRQFLSADRESSGDIQTQPQENSLKLLKETIRLLEKAEQFGIVLDKTEVQNITYDILEKTVPLYLSLFKAALNTVDLLEGDVTNNQRVFYCFFKEYKFMREYLKLAKRLNFNIERYRDLLLSSELAMSEGLDI